MLSQDFKEFVELLIKNKVEYLIVGGYAVGIHGHPRYTGDLDTPTPASLQLVVMIQLTINLTYSINLIFTLPLPPE
jgi:hypothetical protein